MDEVSFDIKPTTDHDVYRQIPSALFIGRETDLKEVSALVSKTMGSSMPFTGIFGEPGSGKASLAQELCGRLMKDGKVKDFFWVSATDTKSTMEGLVHIASRVGILQGNVNSLSESVWKSLQARQTPWL
ncbi:hypothetical protein N7475_000750 [Penicillium sp. IBT 31633x]|nr:hypothetical protein N7475_000750 [Penicillium sp. IBT 31633x]